MSIQVIFLIISVRRNLTASVRISDEDSQPEIELILLGKIGNLNLGKSELSKNECLSFL
jgi:hypothetical protein